MNYERTTLKDLFNLDTRNPMVSTALLTTKHYIPPPRPGLVSRARLVERLDADLGGKLTLISAPAGFGKTTLLAEWIQRDSRPVAWLSLDKSDNDSVGFLTYLLAALGQIEPTLEQNLQAMLTTSQSAAVEPFITALINELAAAGGSTSFTLVLDDYHLIDSAAIHEGITFLVDHLPPQMHLVLVTRADPPLSFSRWRARNQMTEFRARDLRFTAQEAAAFLNGTMGLNLTAEEVSALEGRTEGWIAGLQLAALSLQQQDDPSGFVTAFAGDDRYIADYLLEEVLQGQPEQVQHFLLHTAILKRLSAPLCDAVTDGGNGRAILTALEGSNLFVVPLDNQRHWYRYHHLFADLLRNRLEESSGPQDIKSLHRRASRWYEENDIPVEAVEHALEAGDYEDVIRLIWLVWGEMFSRSRISTLLRWWAGLPPELVTSQPRLCMMYSWAWLATGHPEEAEGCLQAIEQALGRKMAELSAEGEGVEAMTPAVRGALVEVAVVRAQLAIGRFNIHETLKLSRLVLPYLEDDEGPYLHNPPKDSRTVVFINLGMAHKFSGELGAADKAFTNAASLGQERGNVHIVAVAYGQLANVQVIQGSLRMALDTCRRGLQLLQDMVGQRSPMSGLLQTELGNLMYEQNDLESALHHFQEGIAVSKPWGYWAAYVPGYIGLARERAAQGDWQGAFTLMDELAELGQNNPETVMPAVESFRAVLWAKQGDLDAARHWAGAAGLDVDGEINYLREGEFILLARVLLAQGALGEAAGLISRLLEAAENGERWGRVIELLVLQTLVLNAREKQDQAVRTLSRALALAEPQNYVRIFVDEGEPMVRLLYQAAAEGIAPIYTSELLAAFPDTALMPVERSRRKTASKMIEPLSGREIEVLDCIAEGLSNREIAQRLTISLTTVKTHTRNIYSKLDVNSRTQAVAKGKALGIFLDT